MSGAATSGRPPKASPAGTTTALRPDSTRIWPRVAEPGGRRDLGIPSRLACGARVTGPDSLVNTHGPGSSRARTIRQSCSNPAAIRQSCSNHDPRRYKSRDRAHVTTPTRSPGACKPRGARVGKADGGTGPLTERRGCERGRLHVRPRGEAAPGQKDAPGTARGRAAGPRLGTGAAAGPRAPHPRRRGHVPLPLRLLSPGPVLSASPERDGGKSGSVPDKGGPTPSRLAGTDGRTARGQRYALPPFLLGRHPRWVPEGGRTPRCAGRRGADSQETGAGHAFRNLHLQSPANGRFRR